MQAQLLDGTAVRELRVFVVEDESLVAMQLEDMLFDLGCEVIGPAMRLRRAIETVEAGIAADVAILDVNIGGDKVYPVASLLEERGIPIVFATGYGRGGVEERWQNCPILQKPYTARQIEQSLIEALEKKQARAATMAADDQP